MAACACFAQQSLGSLFRIGIASTVPRACGAAVTAGIIQQDAGARLQSVGVTVSDIHNSELAVDLDCVPVNSTGTSLAVHQCLGFSELVSSHDSKPILANTWRKCESYICGTGKCEAPIRAGLNTLVDRFLSDLRDRTAPAVQTASVAYAPQGVTAMERVVFYALYLTLCLTIFLYWQFRKRAY